MKNTKELLKIIIGVIIFTCLLFILVACGAANQEEKESESTAFRKNVVKMSSSEAESEIEETKLEIHFIDVGQAEAILITCDNEAMMIDGGTADKSNLIFSYLKKHEINHLKYIICTHPEADHVGGLSGALNYANIDYAYCSTLQYDSPEFNSFNKYIEEQGKKLEVPKSGSKLTLGDAIMTLYLPTSQYLDSNDKSIVVKLEHGKNSFIFTGDASEAEEKELLKEDNLESLVLKVGHHGSDTSSSNQFLKKVNPKYAVISCGEKNDYGHPADGVLSRLKEQKVSLFRTDMQGTIVCKSNGKTIEFTTEKKAKADTFSTYHDLYGETESTEKLAEQTTAETTTNAEQVETTTAAQPTMTYICNTNTMKFHNPGCRHINSMKDYNKFEFEGTRDEVLAAGYSPCGSCKP